MLDIVLCSFQMEGIMHVKANLSLFSSSLQNLGPLEKKLRLWMRAKPDLQCNTKQSQYMHSEYGTAPKESNAGGNGRTHCRRLGSTKKFTKQENNFHMTAWFYSMRSSAGHRQPRSGALPPQLGCRFEQHLLNDAHSLHLQAAGE